MKTSQITWHNRFMDIAKQVATWSKDPSTKVGAIIVDENNKIISTGYNGALPQIDDEFAIESYKRSQSAWEKGLFENEIVPVEIPQRKGEPILFSKDEELFNVKFDKIPTLNAAFIKEGTVTAANASTMNDGAAALVLMSAEKARELGIKPIAKICSYAGMLSS